MREATYSYVKNLFNVEQIKEINIGIKKNLEQSEKVLIVVFFYRL